MIVVTRSGDTKAKAAFGRSNVVVSSLDTITHQLSIDPELIQGNVEAYIVYEADVHGAKAKQDFITAVANKHSSHSLIELRFYQGRSLLLLQWIKSHLLVWIVSLHSRIYSPL